MNPQTTLSVGDMVRYFSHSFEVTSVVDGYAQLAPSRCAGPNVVGFTVSVSRIRFGYRTRSGQRIAGWILPAVSK